jgi:hypothetical protein
MNEEWVSVYSSSQLYQAELLKHILADNQITAFILNKQDSAYNFGDIEVCVKPADIIKAKHIISKTEF